MSHSSESVDFNAADFSGTEHSFYSNSELSCSMLNENAPSEPMAGILDNQWGHGVSPLGQWLDSSVMNMLRPLLQNF